MSKNVSYKKKKVEQPIVSDSERKVYKTRISFLVEIDADNEEQFNEAVDDIKFHFKDAKTSGISVTDGKGYHWRIMKQGRSDIIVKLIK